ncbi:MAG: hypothetical protein A3I11_02020 [Elusimicrobia bacterium RIFCSPLOWO2_02_FULL_39_32]|nr:MAG: hypothetical protein A2034_01520 [Elusimicrobia bacterium GWA2_38_7]OGR78396.1 MAG: hypothetical protein A3B80_06905 [Elusimicrobia bacterium RIFCSPHIGHO2_02_FULL_39_36]OGR92155.1 MAG: hypothetical protein A3I11_02020 [Elusimicrobia bacterium RIFCSPLOWO2_02_FULL_39_32]OGR99977.1 MAG: hypothetical protein A3G85_03415 [Elusimicrobia bacterium RIFCSPLOWO2_12_FULL_39_28]
MKLLFVLSQIELTGAETYALTLARALKAQGHEIIFVSEKINAPCDFKFYPLPLHTDNHTTFGRIKNIIALKKIIKEENIELIHSHSRAANLASFFAKPKEFPMLVSIHGRWRNHFAARVLPCLGDKTIAICPYLERYLVGELKRKSQTISMIPNGIETQTFFSAAPRENKQLMVLFVGRFSGQKGNVIRYLLREVYPKIGKEMDQVIFKIAALSPDPGDLELIRNLNESLNREAAQLLKIQQNLLPLYQEAELVIGSGRVALEAMSCGKAVVSIGESSSPGIVSKETFELAFDSNFGDCGEWNLFLKKNCLTQEILEILKNKDLRNSIGEWSRSKILEDFDSKKIALKVEKIYQECINLNRWE